MATLKEFIAAHNCEEVGGRLIALVNGKKEYVADVLDSGYTLTYHGRKLPELTPEPVAEEKPKRRKKEAELLDNDLLAGLDQ